MILTPTIARNIVLVAIFQLTNNLYMLFSPQSMGYYYDDTDPFFTSDKEPTDKCRHYTVVFHTFILQTFCQMINARKVFEKDFNVFEGILSNWIYIAILFSTFIIQILFVQFGG